MLPGHPHRVAIALENICTRWVGWHVQTGRECQSYDPGDTAFRDSYLSNISNKLSLNPCNFKCCHPARSQLYPPSRFCMILQSTNNPVPHRHRSYARTRHTLYCLWRSHMQGRIMVNQFLSILYVRPWELVSDPILLMARVLQVCRDLQVHLVQF